jgi:general secretion pathway protein I
MSRDSDAGFTLVEVMVALLIVALAVPALLFTLNQQIDGTAYLRDRSLAQLVAGNRVSELRLTARAGRPLLRGSANGEEEMVGRLWYWSVESTATEVPNFFRIAVSVREQEDDSVPLYTLVAYFTDGDG